MKKTAKKTPVTETIALACYYKQGDDLYNHFHVALEDQPKGTANGCVEAAALRRWAADLADSAKALTALAQLVEENSHTDPTIEAGTHQADLVVTPALAAKIRELKLSIVRASSE